MRSTTKWASVYFVLLMIIGNYILFNLLVAILVEGFSSETVSLQQSCFLNLENLFLKKLLSERIPFKALQKHVRKAFILTWIVFLGFMTDIKLQKYFMLFLLAVKSYNNLVIDYKVSRTPNS